MNLLFGFSGRIGRLQWWLAQLAIPVILLVSVGIIVAFGHADTFDGSETLGAIDNAGWSIILIVIAVVVLIVWINIASTVKRFHDRGKSGYCFLSSSYPTSARSGSWWSAGSWPVRRGSIATARRREVVAARVMGIWRTR